MSVKMFRTGGRKKGSGEIRFLFLMLNEQLFA